MGRENRQIIHLRINGCLHQSLKVIAFTYTMWCMEPSTPVASADIQTTHIYVCPIASLKFHNGLRPNAIMIVCARASMVQEIKVPSQSTLQISLYFHSNKCNCVKEPKGQRSAYSIPCKGAATMVPRQSALGIVSVCEWSPWSTVPASDPTSGSPLSPGRRGGRSPIQWLQLVCRQ